MRVTRLEIENFRSHRATQVDLHPSLNIISGFNGAGKTSLIDAMSICLAGRTPTVAYRKELFNELILTGTDGFHIRLLVEDNGKTYDIHATYTDALNVTGPTMESRAKILWMLNPKAFFESNRIDQQRMIADVMDIPVEAANKAWLAYVKKHGPKSYQGMQVRTVSDLAVMAKRMSEDLKAINKEVKELERYAGLPESKEAKSVINEYRDLEGEIAMHDKTVKMLESMLRSCEDIRVAEAKAEELAKELADIRVAIESDRELQRNNKIIVHFAAKGLCPMHMDCPHKLQDFGARHTEANARISALAEMIAKNEGLATQLTRQLERYSGYVKAKAELDELLRKTNDIEAKKVRRDQLLATMEAEQIQVNIADKKVKYATAVKEQAQVQGCLTLIKDELLPQYSDLDDAFNQLLAASTFPVTYKGGDVCYDGRAYPFLSPSQQYRCQLAVAMAVGGALGIIVADGMEILDDEGRRRVTHMLGGMASRGTQVFILGSYTRPLNDETGPPMKAPKSGSAYWISRNGDGISSVELMK